METSLSLSRNQVVLSEEERRRLPLGALLGSRGIVAPLGTAGLSAPLLVGSSIVPAGSSGSGGCASSTGKAGRGSLPVTTTKGRGLNDGRLLLDGRELLLLGLLLGLSLRVAVCAC